MSSDFSIRIPTCITCHEWKSVDIGEHGNSLLKIPIRNGEKAI